MHRTLDSFFDMEPYIPHDKNVVTISSIYDRGEHADGSETIKIKDWFTYMNYDSSGYMAVVVYELEKASSFLPVALPSSVPVSLANGALLTTFGWTNNGSADVIVPNIVQYRDVNHCHTCSTRFKGCICALTPTPSVPCNIVRGSSLILSQNGKDTLLGMRFLQKKDGCGKTDFPMAGTSFKSVLSWVKAKAHV